MVDEIRKPRTVTREELYALVWQTPMSRLAADFGVSGNGLAKACDRLHVPYPPRGHWAKKDAGKPVSIIPLPAPRDGTPAATDIYPTPPKPELPPTNPQVEQIQAMAMERLADLTVPQRMEKLHPRVQAWVAEHKAEQLKRARDAKRKDRLWSWPLIPDLTERDCYRFRVSSAVFEGIERLGGKLKDTPITGRVVLLIDGHEVKCAIMEKMEKSLKPRAAQQAWTAYPNHHQSGLTSSGFLRISVDVYLPGRKPQWIETDKTPVAKMLPEIVGGIMATGPLLTERKRELDLSRQRYQEEEQRRLAARIERETDEHRWSQFREFAANWEEGNKLRSLISELETRMDREGDVLVGDRPLSAWLGWARHRADQLDPLREGAAALFERIAASKKSGW